jgi:hypothetical protein
MSRVTLASVEWFKAWPLSSCDLQMRRLNQTFQKSFLDVVGDAQVPAYKTATV